MAQVRRLRADLVGNVHIDLHSRLVGDGRQMKHAVGAAPQGHVHGQGIAECRFRHNVPGTDIFLKHIHNRHAGMLGQADPLGVHRRYGAVAFQAHAQHFCQAVHAVGCVHAGAGTAGGTHLALKLSYFFLCHGARRVGAYSLEHAGQTSLFSLHTAGQHGTAADEHRGDIETGRSHQKSRHVFVTVGDHDQGVKLMGDGHALRGVGYQIPGHQRVLHTLMAHGDPVTHRDGGKHYGGSPCHSHTLLHRVHNLVQIHMSRNNLIIRTYDSHKGPCQFFLCQAQRPVERPGRRLLHS